MSQGRGKERFRMAVRQLNELFGEWKKQRYYLSQEELARALVDLIRDYSLFNQLEPVPNWEQIWEPRLAGRVESLLQEAAKVEEKRQALEAKQQRRQAEKAEKAEAKAEQREERRLSELEIRAAAFDYYEGWPIFLDRLPPELADKVSLRRTGFESIEEAIEYSAPFASYVAGFIEIDGLYFAVVEK
jgi:hypothetical protein